MNPGTAGDELARDRSSEPGPLGHRPPDPGEPPALVRRLAGGRRTTAVWRNQVGGTTWQLGEGAGREFLKVGPAHPDFRPGAEAERLRWASCFLPVPEVLGFTEGPEPFLHTRGLDGENAIAPRQQEHPEVVVPALGRGLRQLHESLPVADCPFTWSVTDRLATRTGPDDFADLLRPVPDTDLVVCHGDACSPNFLIDDRGRVCGYVDLDALGVADRHADLAPALLSLGWNFGPGWEAAFLDGYGLPVDQWRLRRYIELWNAT